MQMSLDEFSARFPNRRRPLPAKFAGQWVAWNEDRSEILAHGEDMSEVRDQAIACGCTRPLLQKVPRAPFVGRA